MKQRIGFGPRLGAFLLDIFLVGLISFFIVGVLGVGGMAAGAAAGSGETDSMALGMSMGFLGGLFASIIVIYITTLIWYLLEGITGFTIGKLIVGIQIGNENGTKANIGKLMVRYLIKNIAQVFAVLSFLTSLDFFNKTGGILGLVIFIGCFFVLGSKKQAIHDMIANTAVYNRRDLK